MVQKNQRNHYNIKFLKGYGISVNLKDNKLILKNGYDYFTKQQEREEWFVKNMPYEKIVLCGKELSPLKHCHFCKFYNSIFKD